MKITRYLGLEWTGSSAEGRERFGQAVSRLPEGDGPDDSAGDLLIYASEDRAEHAFLLLAEFAESLERVRLLRFDGTDSVPGPSFEDYLFPSLGGGLYADLSSAAAFSLSAEKPGAEPAPAMSQLEEHLIATFGGGDEGGDPLLVIDRQLADLAERIARAYGCEVRWEALDD